MSLLSFTTRELLLYDFTTLRIYHFNDCFNSFEKLLEHVMKPQQESRAAVLFNLLCVVTDFVYFHRFYVNLIISASSIIVLT